MDQGASLAGADPEWLLVQGSRVLWLGSGKCWASGKHPEVQQSDMNHDPREQKKHKICGDINPRQPTQLLELP